MRVKVLLAFLGLGLALALVGCSGNEKAFTVTGTVTDLSGNLVSGTATMLQDSIVVKTVNFTNGKLVVSSLPVGVYAMEITGMNLVPTYVGLFSPTQNPTLKIAVPTVAELNARGIATPDAGSSTLFATAVDTSGNQLALAKAPLPQFSVKVGTMAAVPSTLNNPSYAVVTGITPGEQQVVVTNTANNGETVFPEVTFVSGQFTALLAIVPSGGILNEFNANGSVSDAATAQGIPDLNVAVRELTDISTTTNAVGNFSYTDLSANVYTLKLNSNTQSSASIFTTFAGPFAGSSGTVTLPSVSTFKQNETGSIDGGITVPTDGTATLVVYANGATVTSAVVKVQGKTGTGAPPIIITGLTATTTGSDIEVQADGQDVVLKSVPLAANNITVVTAFIP